MSRRIAESVQDPTDHGRRSPGAPRSDHVATAGGVLVEARPPRIGGGRPPPRRDRIDWLPSSTPTRLCRGRTRRIRRADDSDASGVVASEGARTRVAARPRRHPLLRPPVLKRLNRPGLLRPRPDRRPQLADGVSGCRVCRRASVRLASFAAQRSWPRSAGHAQYASADHRRLAPAGSRSSPKKSSPKEPKYAHHSRGVGRRGERKSRNRNTAGLLVVTSRVCVGAVEYPRLPPGNHEVGVFDATPPDVAQLVIGAGPQPPGDRIGPAERIRGGVPCSPGMSARGDDELRYLPGFRELATAADVLAAALEVSHTLPRRPRQGPRAAGRSSNRRDRRGDVADRLRTGHARPDRRQPPSPPGPTSRSMSLPPPADGRSPTPRASDRRERRRHLARQHRVLSSTCALAG